MSIADGGRMTYNDTHTLDRCHHHLVGGVVVSETFHERSLEASQRI